MPSISRTIYGGDRLRETLRRLPSKVRNRVASRATQEAARVVQDAARSNINVRTGRGRRSVKVRRAKRGKDKTAHEVYSDYKTLLPDGYYTAYLEYGWVSPSGRFVDEYKWLEPAVDVALPSALATMRRVVEEELRTLASSEGQGSHGRRVA